MRLILFIANEHGGGEVERLLAFVEVDPTGCFSLPLRDRSTLSKEEIADAVAGLDDRLEWERDRWEFS
jgi:hypothetical protein